MRSVHVPLRYLHNADDGVLCIMVFIRFLWRQYNNPGSSHYSALKQLPVNLLIVSLDITNVWLLLRK